MKIPEPAWAVFLAVLGTAVALAVLYSNSDANVKVAVLAVASSLVSGALGAFAGRAGAAGQNNAANPTEPAA